VKGNLLAQYLRIKAQHAEAILLFRLGDFYEMFFDDAKDASSLLDLTLTARNRGDPDEVPLCGFPAHAASPYVARLLAAGRSVAVCEQIEAKAKGLMEREVVRVVTPGTVLEEESLDPGAPSLLAALAATEDGFGLTVVDVSTGRFRVTEGHDWMPIREELARLAPRELLLDAALAPELAARCHGLGAAVADLPAAGGDDAGDTTDLGAPARRAVAGARAYLAATFRRPLRHLAAPEPYALAGFLTLDATTRRNLELVETLRGERRGSLLGILDETSTPMGGRQLREWLLYPLLDVVEAGRRLDAVEWLVESADVRAAVREALTGSGDLARLAGRVGAGTAGPRDLASVAAALRRTAAITAALTAATPPLVGDLAGRLDPLPDVVALVETALVEQPPPHTRIPGFIRSGAHPEVDELRATVADGKGWIARFETAERRRTGIPTLKIRHNKVFGYYLEVTKTHLGSVPTDYERKQTLVGAERFVTPALKEQEARVLGAEDRLRTLEQHVFEGLLGRVQAVQPTLARTASALAGLDTLAALAEVAHRRSWTRPRLTTRPATRIRGGRHPVVEALGAEAFVPNDVDLDADGTQIVILTGPNMGGKSTYLRQTALLTILAHMGSFVPAADAEIGLTDRVFTRVGASDDLVRGESTFMVEMRETAHILANLTDRSLVILDEIGRGTSTFDGISIAWAVAEYLHDAPTRPRTLFATHYHELTALAAERERVRNLSVAVAEWKGDIVFLRQIVPGPASRSYGLDVAKLAGVPAPVVDRARALLAELEAGEGPAHGAAAGPAEQLSLFDDPGAGLVRALGELDVDHMTPVEALGHLAELVREARRPR
jgi:DNA mismatch repair protein MutS